MNKYGIREMETFKAPSRKPWMVILIVLVLGLCAWLVVHLAVGSKDTTGEGSKKSASPPAASGTDKEAKTVSRTDKTSSTPSAVTSAPGSSKKQTKPPVDLEAAKRPAAATGGKVGKAALAQALVLIKKNERIAARDLLQKVLKGELADTERAEIEGMLGKINTELVFLPYEMPEKLTHVVKRGDSLGKLAKEHGVTIESIQVINRIKNPNHIRPDDIVKILDADYSIQISRASLKLTLLMDGKFFKSYPIAIGKFDKTPTGTFEIVDRLKNPVWYRDDGREIPFGHKENILGTRWMSIRATGETPPVKSLGIHGTWDDESIGKMESAGCVRMHNKDVEELFALVPVGTPVTILK